MSYSFSFTCAPLMLKCTPFFAKWWSYCEFRRIFAEQSRPSLFCRITPRQKIEAQRPRNYNPLLVGCPAGPEDRTMHPGRERSCTVDHKDPTNMNEKSCRYTHARTASCSVAMWNIKPLRDLYFAPIISWSLGFGFFGGTLYHKKLVWLWPLGVSFAKLAVPSQLHQERYALELKSLHTWTREQLRV